MNTQMMLFGLIVLAVVVIGFFAVFRGEGKFNIKSKFGEASAEGKNPPPPSAVPSGVKVKGVESGQHATVHSSSSGGVDAENIKAKGNVSTTHTPGEASPKD